MGRTILKAVSSIGPFHLMTDTVFKRIFDVLSEEPDMEYAMIDATIVKVHRHGMGAKGGLKARP